jgi:hypothetical protein
LKLTIKDVYHKRKVLRNVKRLIDRKKRHRVFIRCKMKFVVGAFIILHGCGCFSQTAALRTTNWHQAGLHGSRPVYTQTINITAHGGSPSAQSNNAALAAAINALNKKPGVIFFPPGVYTFTAQVNITRDSIIFVGAGHDRTRLNFKMNGVLNHCINIAGKELNTDTTAFTTVAVRDSNSVMVNNAGFLNSGDWVYLQCNDSAYVTSSWAHRSVGQIMQVKSVAAKSVSFFSPFRFHFLPELKPVIKKILPRQGVGFECLSVQRHDPTSFQTSLFCFDRAVHCWLHGVEGDSTNYAHVELDRSSNISITNSWFHHALAYGSAQGYGVALQYSSNECLVENNIFEHLRHSILFQAGANGNVIGYNYMTDPFWKEGFFPSNSAGDIVFHGNYPFFNLVEGNVNQNSIIDNSHGKSGPYNTMFRNRIGMYGIIMNSGAADSMQFAGNEITGTGSLMGNYSISGNGHKEVANLVGNVITPGNSATVQQSSLYHSGSARPACFDMASQNWPLFGDQARYNLGTNSARDRYSRGIFAECECSFNVTSSLEDTGRRSFKIFPNPVKNRLCFTEPLPASFCILTLDGRCVLCACEMGDFCMDVTELAPGCYIVVSERSTKQTLIIKE